MIIYKTTNLINGKIYIGQDSFNNPDYFGSGTALCKAIKKYGKENFRKDIIQFCHSKEELGSMEVWWINVFNSRDKKIGYNITKGGAGRLGSKVSEETKQKLRIINLGKKASKETKEKMSLSRKGKKPTLGTKHSEETKLKMSLASKGKKKPPFSEEHKQKIKIARKKQQYSEETKKKMSLAHKGHKYNLGRYPSEETKKKMSLAQKRRRLNTESV